MNKSNKTVKISVAGSAGRMGKMLVSAVHSHPECSLVAATCHPSESDVIGKDAGLVSGLDYINVPISSILQCVKPKLPKTKPLANPTMQILCFM